MNFDPSASLYGPGTTGLSRRVTPQQSERTLEHRQPARSWDGDQYLAETATPRPDTGLYCPARLVSTRAGQPRPLPTSLAPTDAPQPRTRAEAQLQAAMTAATSAQAPDDLAADFQLGFAITA
jgi:hypothetical protein